MTPAERSHVIGLAVAFLRNHGSPLARRLAEQLGGLDGPPADGVVVDLTAGEVRHGGRTATLPRRPLRLLHTLAAAEGNFVELPDLLREAWSENGEEPWSAERVVRSRCTVKSAVDRLRGLLRERGLPEIGDGIIPRPGGGAWTLRIGDRHRTGDTLDGAASAGRLSTVADEKEGQR